MTKSGPRAFAPALVVALGAALALAALALVVTSPASTQTEVTTLATLRALAGEDPRADFARLRIPSIGVNDQFRR